MSSAALVVVVVCLFVREREVGKGCSTINRTRWNITRSVIDLGRLHNDDDDDDDKNDDMMMMMTTIVLYLKWLLFSRPSRYLVNKL